MRTLLTAVLSLNLIAAAGAAEDPFAGYKQVTRGLFVSQGHKQYGFQVNGHGCQLVVPKKAAPGNPWIWRARFWGAFPAVDLAMLEQGYHIAHINVGNCYGNPEALRRFDAFYQHMTEKHGLSAKPALEGLSRGGLIIINWARRNPGRVSLVYGDAPVCDYRSWPGWSKEDYQQKCLDSKGFAGEKAADYLPVDNLEPLAKADVPILIVCGDADKVVPIAKNALVVKERYRKLGGRIKLIIKKGCDHHPHGLTDPRPAVEFILAHTEATKGETRPPVSYEDVVLEKSDWRKPKNK